MGTGFFSGGVDFLPAKFFIAFLDVSRHAERAERFDAMLFLGEKKN